MALFVLAVEWIFIFKNSNLVAEGQTAIGGETIIADLSKSKTDEPSFVIVK
jgi:hypothetical protein